MDTAKRKIINEILLKLNAQDPQTYYLSATDTASIIRDYVSGPNDLPKDKLKLVQDMSQEEIRYALSFYADKNEGRNSVL